MKKLTVLYRTIGQFITQRLRLYLARLLFTSANKPITENETTKHLNAKIAVLICDCFTDDAFLQFLKAHAVLRRQELLAEYNYSVITLPEEQRIVYDAIAHMMTAEGLPPMTASSYENRALYLDEGSTS